MAGSSLVNLLKEFDLSNCSVGELSLAKAIITEAIDQKSTGPVRDATYFDVGFLKDLVPGLLIEILDPYLIGSIFQEALSKVKGIHGGGSECLLDDPEFQKDINIEKFSALIGYGRCFMDIESTPGHTVHMFKKDIPKDYYNRQQYRDCFCFILKHGPDMSKLQKLQLAVATGNYPLYARCLKNYGGKNKLTYDTKISRVLIVNGNLEHLKQIEKENVDTVWSAVGDLMKSPYGSQYVPFILISSQCFHICLHLLQKSIRILGT